MLFTSFNASAGGRWQALTRWMPHSAILIGTLFFSASLTPSLIPRTYLVEGILSGLSFSFGFAIGMLCHRLWEYMHFPKLAEPQLSIIRASIIVICAASAMAFLWLATDWQNSLREFMNVERVSRSYSFLILLVAAITVVGTFGIASLFLLVFRRAQSALARVLPRRVSRVIGFAVAIIVFWGVANGVLFRVAFHLLDSSFREYDSLIEAGIPRPTSSFRTGSVASGLIWDELGRAGREFVGSGPTAAEISFLTAKKALEPIRVYVGLRAAETVDQRVDLAVEELKRMKAFDRSTLVIATPTGTGWVDPAAIDSAEYLANGDIATVAVQYSYFSSPLSLLIEPQRGADTATSLFKEVYKYWTNLPKGKRPRLLVYGLSLGSLNSEKSIELFDILSDPINGALWSGPPFENQLWRSITKSRQPGSPAWLPQYSDGSVVRFMNQRGSAVAAGSRWGAMRIVYLQYASDPVTFFDYADLYREPDWMVAPRGPDVSPDFQWYPVITLLQLGFDMALATTTPIGLGHVYAPDHYVDAWVAVAALPGWTDEQVERLKQHLDQKMERDLTRPGEANPYEARGG